MLTGNTKGLGTCHTRIIVIKESLFIKLEESNSYIFTSPSAEQLHLKCLNDTDETTVQLSGTGVLKLNSKCQAYTSTLSLPTHNTFENRVYITYVPKVKLPFTFKFVESDGAKFHIPEISSSLVVTNNDEINQLGQRVEHLKLIESVSDTVKFHDNLTYSLIGLFIFSILLYVSVPKVISALRKKLKVPPGVVESKGELNEAVELEQVVDKNRINPRYDFHS